MKKYCFFMILLFASVVSYAQSLDDINKLMLLAQNKKAKEGIDKFLSDAKNATKAIGWFYKGRIYNAVSKDSGTTPTDALKLKGESFEAFKKYQQLDAKQENFKQENYASYFDLYNGYFDIGAREFNSKNFTNSFEGFKNALAVEEYVRSKGYEYNGFKFSALDTSLVMNTAIAAGNAKNEDASIPYYRQLTDANVSGENFLNVYEFLLEYYIKKKDEPNIKLMFEKGRAIYPQEKWFTEKEIDMVDATGDKKALMAKYEELMKREPNEFTWAYNLGVEMFNELYVGDNKPADPEAVKLKLTEVIKTAISIDKGIDGKMLMTRHLYNVAYDFQDSTKKIKGVKPEDIKKKAEAKAQFMKKLDDCIPYAEAVTSYLGGLPTLKPAQKSNYKIVLDYLSQIYAAKGDMKKSAEYDKKKAEVDKL